MPPIRDHEMVYEDVDEDDGMPPLVDNPNPSMTYTFFTDMTPISFSPTFTNPSTSNQPPDTLPTFDAGPATLSPSPLTSTPPASPLFLDDGLMTMPASSPHGPTPGPSTSLPTSTSYTPRGSHGKKRDASYIPRPPNAFILFRSSFIRSQQVPGKVEGNHSTLSKIIGMYWKTLPREEREQWEAKAVVAQAEHRKRYPDWRFRPGANAMAKLKVKDGGGGPGGGVGGGGSGSRKRNQSVSFGMGLDEGPSASGSAIAGGSGSGGGKGKGKAKDTWGLGGEGRGGKGKGKGKEKEKDSAEKEREREREKEKKGKSKEKRCAKIAGLLVEGKKGAELEVAVQEWEGGRRARKKEKREVAAAIAAAAIVVEEGAKDLGEKTVEGGDKKDKGKGKASVEDTPSTSGARDGAMEVVEGGGSGSESGTERGSVATADAEGEDYISDGTEYASLHTPSTSASSGLSPNPNPIPNIHEFSPTLNNASPYDLDAGTVDGGQIEGGAREGAVPQRWSQAQRKRSKTPDRSQTLPDEASTDTFKVVPLTSMFKRSLSAPASHTRSPYPYPRRYGNAANSAVHERGRGRGRGYRHGHSPSVDVQVRGEVGMGTEMEMGTGVNPPPQVMLGQTHARRDTVSLPMDASDHVPHIAPPHVPHTTNPHPHRVQPPHPRPPLTRQPRSPLAHQIQPQPLSALLQQSPPEVQPDLTPQSHSLLTQQRQQHQHQTGTNAHPLSVRWQEEEDRRRYEDTHGYWWPSSTTHTFARLGDGNDGNGTTWEGAMYQQQQQQHQGIGTEGMGYDIAVERGGEYINPFAPAGDGSDIVDWTTNPDRVGLVAVIHDPYLPYMAPNPPQAHTQVQDHTHNNSDPDADGVECTSAPTSPVSPTAISSFSTLTGWAGDFESFTSTSTTSTVASGFSSGSGPTRSPAMSSSSSVTASSSSSASTAWYQAPGWDSQLQPMNLHEYGADNMDVDVRMDGGVLHDDLGMGGEAVYVEGAYGRELEVGHSDGRRLVEEMGSAGEFRFPSAVGMEALKRFEEGTHARGYEGGLDRERHVNTNSNLNSGATAPSRD